MRGCNSRGPAAEAERPMLWSCLAAAEQSGAGTGPSLGGQGITQRSTSLPVQAGWVCVCASLIVILIIIITLGLFTLLYDFTWSRCFLRLGFQTRVKSSQFLTACENLTGDVDILTRAGMAYVLLLLLLRGLRKVQHPRSYKNPSKPIWIKSEMHVVTLKTRPILL